MGSAKNIVLNPISSKDANAFVRKVHYSGKVVNNSQLHIGVFWEGKLEGVMQFGPSLDKKKIQGLVRNTGWNEFIELNRMAFSDKLPKNSESRAIAIAMKMLKKHAPHIKWVISFADACQCGDGTIYRASGFVLTGIKENSQLYQLPFAHEINTQELKRKGLQEQEIIYIKNWLDYITKGHKLSLQDRPPTCHKLSLEGEKMSFEGNNLNLSRVKNIMRRITNGGTSANKLFTLIGGKPLIGYQLRYIYFIDRDKKKDLTVAEIPYCRIKELGATMYKGKRAND